jgi:hypothetical protein
MCMLAGPCQPSSIPWLRVLQARCSALLLGMSAVAPAVLTNLQFTAHSDVCVATDCRRRPGSTF